MLTVLNKDTDSVEEFVFDAFVFCWPRLPRSSIALWSWLGTSHDHKSRGNHMTHEESRDGLSASCDQQAILDRFPLVILFPPYVERSKFSRVQ